MGFTQGDLESGFILFLVSQSQQRWKNRQWNYRKDCLVSTSGQVEAGQSKGLHSPLPKKGLLGEE